MTSTYGEGDAPSNADQFAYKFKKYKQLKTNRIYCTGVWF